MQLDLEPPFLVIKPGVSQDEFYRLDEDSDWEYLGGRLVRSPASDRHDYLSSARWRRRSRLSPPVVCGHRRAPYSKYPVTSRITSTLGDWPPMDAKTRNVPSPATDSALTALLASV
jgi:hypothetical protein